MDKTATPVRPPDRDGLVWRGLGREDLEEWFALVQRIQQHDREHVPVTWDEHERAATMPYVDLPRDALAAVDDEGVLRAVGRNAFQPGGVDDLMVTLVGGVDPDWRGRGLGRDLLGWQVARARQNVEALREEPGAADLPARAGAFVEDHLTARARLFEAGGFTATRWFEQMHRDLATHPARGAGRLPAGLDVVTFGPDVSERVRLAHNEAFLDHWGSHPASSQDWAADCADERFRPAMSFAVVDAGTDGAPVVAYALSYEIEDLAAPTPTVGYTDLVGVRRAWRGRGLATLLLERTAAAVAEAGLAYATLGVDSDNPSGAGGLYASLGYQTVRRTTYWSLPLR